MTGTGLAPVVVAAAGETDLVPAGLPGTAALLDALREAGLPIVPAIWDPGPWNDLEDRVDRDLLDAAERAGDGAVVMLGIGEAGLLAPIFASLHPERVASLVLVGTPVDLAVLPPDATGRDDRRVDARLALHTALSSPVLGTRFRHDVPVASLPRVLAGQPVSGGRLGQFARTWLTAVGRDNRFLAGTLPVGERHADPGAITVPILNVLPADGGDPLARSAGALAWSVGSEHYEEAALLGPPGDRLGGPLVVATVASLIAGWLGRR